MNEEISENTFEPDSDKIAQDAVPLCPICLEPCDPRDHYCPKCGSNEAINPLASYMPFESIRFEAGMFGKLWHKAWDPRISLWTNGLYICVFILFMPIMFLMLLICAGYQFMFGKKRLPKNEAHEVN